MDKRHAHHLWTKLRWLKPWYFLVIAIVSTVICIAALRANNERMITLRDAVYTADKNDGNVKEALKTLQVYVTAHMNTNLSAGPNAVYPPIQLKYTYDRLVQAESSATANGNSTVYTAAQDYCQKLYSGGQLPARTACVQQYVASHGTTQNLPPPIPDALYKFDFISPKWSPDRAGWSMLIAAVGGLLFVTTLLAKKFLKS